MPTTTGSRTLRSPLLAGFFLGVAGLAGAGCAGMPGSTAEEHGGQAIQPIDDGGAANAERDAVVVLTSSASLSTTTSGAATTEPDGAMTAGGCSLTSEPQKGAVEHAAGLVALLATLFGLRRRARDDAEREHELDGGRPRLPSLP